VGNILFESERTSTIYKCLFITHILAFCCLFSTHLPQLIHQEIPARGGERFSRRITSELRADATAMISDECHEYLCIQMGKTPAVILSAKEIVTGLKAHFASMTDVAHDEVMTSLQNKWTP